MKTAYLINCHKNIDHVSRLAHRLHSEDSHIFIHIDKKVSQEIYNSLCLSVADLKYCYVSESRINGKLDDRSLVDIVMTLIADSKKIAQMNNIHYSYYSNMSGQDYLIKPMKTVEELLEISERYHEITREVAALEHQLELVGKAKDRAFGKNKVAAIKDEIKAQKELIQNNKDLLKEAEDYLALDKQELINNTASNLTI
jgi:hypothetical protein